MWRPCKAKDGESMKADVVKADDDPVADFRQNRAHFGHTRLFLTKNPEALQRLDFLFHKGKCSKEDSNLHRFPY